jgi:hypothetical protein
VVSAASVGLVAAALGDGGAVTASVDLTVYGPIGVLALFAIAAATYLFRALKGERDARDKAMVGIVVDQKEDVAALSKAHADNMLALGERHRAEFVRLTEECRTQLQQIQGNHRSEMQAMVDRHIAAIIAHGEQYHAMSDKMSTVLDSLAHRVEVRRPR